MCNWLKFMYEFNNHSEFIPLENADFFSEARLYN